MQLTITANSYPELKEKLLVIVIEMYQGVPSSLAKAASLTPTIDAITKPAPAPEPAPAKKVKKEKAESAPQTEPTPAPAAATPKKEDAIEALKQVNLKFGMEKARKLLSDFQVQRLSELKPEKLPAFVSACQQALS